jgi:hypothetical protein
MADKWLFPAREFLSAVVAVAALTAGSSRADDKKESPDVPLNGAVSSKDDALLWRAGTTCKYNHNRVVVLPEPWKEHADLLNRYADAKDDERRARFAKAAIARDAVDEEQRILKAAEGNLQGQLPAALKRSMADAVLETLLGCKPAWRDMDVQGGIVKNFDELRKTKLAIELAETYHYHIGKSIADQVEEHYRKTLGNKALPDDAGLIIRGGHSTAQISHTGTKPLTNVVVVTRAKMRQAGLKEDATRAAINFFNEAVDPGADANKVARQYMEAAKVLHQTPQAVFIYVPVLEPGDDLTVELHGYGYHWDIMEGKVSFYCDAGAVLDKVVLVGGPHNDLSLSAEERRRLTKPPPKEKPVGPTFSYLGRTEIVLKKDAKGPFERCVPVDMSFLPVGIKDEVEAGKPLEVIARSADAFVAVGPKKLTGNALVLVSKSLVAKVNDLSKKRPK